MSTTTSPLISALDNYTQREVGENGHIQFGWSNEFSEQVVQYYFQLVRTSSMSQIMKLGDKLQYIINCYISATKQQQKQALPTFISLYKLIAQTRDIVAGKGEYTLAYMQIAVWANVYPEAAKYALEKMVLFNDEDSETDAEHVPHQYGSWKDIKYFCHFMRNEVGASNDDPLIVHAIKLICDQLRKDYDVAMKYLLVCNDGEIAVKQKPNISLAARWVPRAKSKFGWLYNLIADEYNSHIIATATEPTSVKRAHSKARMEFRKLISSLNKHLDTTQIKQCSKGKRWSDIDFNTVTSITMRKQKSAFQYVNSRGASREPQDNPDRKKCAENYSAHIAAASAGDKRYKIRGKRVGVGEMVKDAIQLARKTANADQINYYENTPANQEAVKKMEEERKVINSQWRDNSKQNKGLPHAIACVDTSGSMTADNSVPLYNAIGLGIRIAEKSLLGRRILTFSQKPSWVNLENKGTADDDFDFCEAVSKVQNSPWGMNTNFHALLDMILDACKMSNLPANAVEKMMLVVLSDMQIDSASSEFKNESMMSLMERKYRDAGYKVPHIVFWNLRVTDGFPVLSTKKNTTMMSGFSPVLLNEFMNKGISALKEFTPWSQLESILSNERYNCMEIKLIKILEEQDNVNINMPEMHKESNYSSKEDKSEKDPLSTLKTLSHRPPPPPPASN